MALPAKQMVLFVWGSRPLLSAMKYSIIIYLDPDYSKRAVLLYNTNKPMDKHDDVGRIKLKKIIDKLTYDLPFLLVRCFNSFSFPVLL